MDNYYISITVIEALQKAQVCIVCDVFLGPTSLWVMNLHEHIIQT